MNIFFGKISKEIDLNQIKEGYYQAPKGSTWFGDIEVGDYAYIVGAGKIQLWRAREWGKKDEKECLWFDILNSNLNINLNKFIALDFFKLTPALIVSTARSARNRAFFKINLLKDLTIAYIKDPKTYKDNLIYRKILLHESYSMVESSSTHIQLYYDNNNLKLYESEFLDDSIIKNFRDNLKYAGKGAADKDKIISLIKSKKPEPTIEFTYGEVSLRDLYDSFFCEYKIKDNLFETVKNKFDKSVFERFVELIRTVCKELNLKKFDERIVFSLGNSQLNFTVGQRYCFNLYASRTKKKFGVISKNSLCDDSEPYNGEPPQPYYNYIEDFKPTKEEWSAVITAIKEEAEKTKKSGFKKNNNSDFEDYIFDSNTQISMEGYRGMNFPLNQILYGPPGTGKTYNTVFEAAQIITPEKIVSDYEEALDIFNANLGKRIEFITFHQSYSYEDFIQGLRPDVEVEGSLSFERKDGVFKKISDIAYQNLLDAEKDVDKIREDFDIVFKKFTAPIQEGESHEIEIPMKKVSFFITGITSKSIEFRKNDGNSQHTLSIETLRKMYNKGRNDIILGGLQPYYNPILNILLEAGKIQDARVYKQNYVLIIDEINRANISRVFGELITLIEPDKRSHGKIPLKCTLPSGEDFIVPSNLYIIGTMNTADKSIALLDIALRRRFEFIPMYPDYNLEFQGKEVLRLINEKIIELKGHDFQIGHGYFMSDNFNLVDCMNKKVIPLLMEYFLNDENEVKNILSHAGLYIKEDIWPLKVTD
jgi:hypothetical protein